MQYGTALCVSVAVFGVCIGLFCVLIGLFLCANWSVLRENI